MHRNTEITLAPFTSTDNEEIGIKKVIEQNNFTNQHLYTIGKQLDRM